MRRGKSCRQGRKEGILLPFRIWETFFCYLYFSLPPLGWIGIITFFFLLGSVMTDFLLPFSFLLNIPQKPPRKLACSLDHWPLWGKKFKKNTERWKKIYYFSWIETLLSLPEFPFLSISLFSFPISSHCSPWPEDYNCKTQRFCPLLTYLNPFSTLTSLKPSTEDHIAAPPQKIIC